MFFLKLTSLLRKSSSCLVNVFTDHDLYYVAEAADWVILQEGRNIQKYIDQKQCELALTYSTVGLRDSIVHYGTEGLFFDAQKIKRPHKSNKVIVTCFHIKDDEPRFNYAIKADQFICRWHTACKITRDKLIRLGIREEKIDVIPLGIEPEKFFPWGEQKKTALRRHIGIEPGTLVLGYFQKDGIGWGQGTEPKFEKGPDVFCDVVEKLAAKHKIFVLLTGPARGYVKSRLSAANIPFMHHYLKKPHEVADYFRISDFYLVTSREEGGPKAILESMACGVPIVSTRVGMAPEVIIDGENGFLVDIGDIEALTNRATEILANNSLRRRLIDNGFRTVERYHYQNIAREYAELYQKVKSST